MVLERQRYVPTLAIRPSEMRGLQYLAQVTKSRMTPCFLLAPWTTAQSLDRAMDKIEEVFPTGQYFLDIDKDYQVTNEDNPAQLAWRDLSNPNDVYANWRSFVERWPRAMPALQLGGLSQIEIRQQIDHFQNASRLFALRVFLGRTARNLNDAVEALNASGTADYAIILEGGWQPDPLQSAATFSGLLSGPLISLNATVPAVISCTSIPKTYSSISGHRNITFSNRQLLDQVQRAANRARVIYGDWGSTRPREHRSGGVPIPPRIDYALDQSWVISRNPERDWTFQMAAEHLITNSGFWQGNTLQWGEEMIQQTAANQAIGINSHPKNVAARVNLHLHRQAFYGDDLPGLVDLEDPYEDI